MGDKELIKYILDGSNEALIDAGDWLTIYSIIPEIYNTFFVGEYLDILEKLNLGLNLYKYKSKKIYYIGYDLNSEVRFYVGYNTGLQTTDNAHPIVYHTRIKAGSILVDNDLIGSQNKSTMDNLLEEYEDLLKEQIAKDPLFEDVVDKDKIKFEVCSCDVDSNDLWFIKDIPVTFDCGKTFDITLNAEVLAFNERWRQLLEEGDFEI